MIKTCPICGNKFKVANWNANKKYCSKECVRLSQFKEKIVKVCELCGNTFKVIPYRKDAKFCSSECFKKSRIGKRYGNDIKIYDDYAELIINSKKYNNIKVLISIDDVEKVKKYTWCLTRSPRSNLYVMTKLNNVSIKLHRYLTNCPDNMVVDHINHNTLDNRQENLKICSILENAQNLEIRTPHTYIYTFVNGGYRINISRNGIKYFKYARTLQEAFYIRDDFLKNNYQKLNYDINTLQKILNQNLYSV